MDSTLAPTRAHRLAARSKNYRCSTNPQVAIDADTRLVIATGDPKPGNRNDRTVYRDCGIADVLHGRPVMARMKNWTTLRDTASGIAHLHNLAPTG